MQSVPDGEIRQKQEEEYLMKKTGTIVTALLAVLAVVFAILGVFILGILVKHVEDTKKRS